MKLSIIMPARKEPLMQKTIDSLIETSELGGSLEILAVLDGPWQPAPWEHPLVKAIRIEPGGMRAGINAGLKAATGDWVMKLDAHCAFEQGFDRSMVENCQEDWLMIPRRYSLDDINWKPLKNKPARDYHFLHYPNPLMTPHDYPRESLKEIDDTMSFQGSCWIANRKYFMSRVGYLDDRRETYGSFAAEQLEVGLSYWLGGGQVKVNKKTWYAHLFKNPRHYASGEYEKKANFNRGWLWATNHWVNNEEPGMKHPFSWLVEKFMPVPTWPADKSQWNLG